jgi:SAM-dependent methyltransferase
MGQEINLMINYPRPNRNVKSRGATKTEKDRALARKFGKEFFDGDRAHGYGGFNYHPRFWQPVIPTFREHWGLKSDSSLLDVGCAKGFMMHDFAKLIPGITVKGIDVSEYAIKNAIDDMRSHVEVANAKSLPYPDNSFDYIISVTTIHNLDRSELIQSLQEIERVARLGSFITVDAFRNDEERERMFAWNLTAKTILHVDEWKDLFKDAGFTGDYYWFMP